MSDAPEGGGERIAGRYEELGEIGRGSMGEVRRVRDLTLDRTLAMKIVHAEVFANASLRARFEDEARATARLQHPAIVPVHDVGTLPDGRTWFTMAEIHGRTLGEVITEVHAASAARWEPGPSGWTFQRIMAAFQAVCHAVAHAHARGVVHRDLKPANVMVGDNGEVYLLDWGLAKVLGASEPSGPDGDADRAPGRLTRYGQIAGTPAYMAPEQARGEVDRIDERSDVYALGAVLYEILSGRPPYEGVASSVIAQVRAGPPVPVGRAEPVGTFGFGLELDEAIGGGGGPPLPEELVHLCGRAMAREPDERYRDASEVAMAVQAWLDGSRRVTQALELTDRALAQMEEARALATRAAELRAQSAALLDGIAGWEPEERKAPGWERAAEAEAEELAVQLKELEVDHGFEAALRIVPDLQPAHEALVRRFRERHVAAEGRRDARGMAEARIRLEAHVAALPEADPLRVATASYLRGMGALTLVTDPPGASVSLYRYVERNRRLIEVFERDLGKTPIHAVELPMGSYLARIRHPLADEVRYPFAVERQRHWDGVPPGARDPLPIRLPPTGFLGPDEVYVPAGWFRAGERDDPTALPAARMWCDALVMERFPVTCQAYLDFLNAAVAAGREEEALLWAPRHSGGVVDEPGPMVVDFAGGRFSLTSSRPQDQWYPRTPVVLVTSAGALAFLAARRAATGRPWRLPGELEWEKAARGVDGRAYPWGDNLDPCWTCMTDSHRTFRRPSLIDDYPVDISVYGVRGLGGCVQDFTADLYDRPPVVGPGRRVEEPPMPTPDAASTLTARGGSWFTTARACRSAGRFRRASLDRQFALGFRGVYRPWAADGVSIP